MVRASIEPSLEAQRHCHHIWPEIAAEIRGLQPTYNGKSKLSGQSDWCHESCNEACDTRRSGQTQNPAKDRYNELMNCRVKDELVRRLIALNNKLNLLSPDLVHGDEERAEVQQRRESLYTEIKRHRANGHKGRPCPAAKEI